MADSATPRAQLPYFLLVAAVLLVFGRAIDAPFVFDDHALLADPAITSAEGWWQVWRPAQSRPLTYFSFWLNWRLGGVNPAGFHAVNIALHAISCCLVLSCFRKLMPAAAALVGAVVFALHPIQTEAVVYVFARSTLFASCLTFASFRQWLLGHHWRAVVVFAVALLAKEEVAAYPVFLALLHLVISANKSERLPIAAMLVLSVAAVGRVAILTIITPGSGAGPQAGISPADYFMTQGFVILRYLQMLIIPAGFTLDPQIEVIRGWLSLLCWASVASAAYLAFFSLDRARIGFWFIAGLILLTPTSSIFPANDLAADRRMYLPMLAFSAVAGRLLETTRYPVLLPAGAALLAMLSLARINVWRNEASLWEDALAWAPEKVRPRIQLSRLVPPDRGLQYLQEAKKIAPDDPNVASELGRVYLSMGKASEALSEFGRAVALSPNDARALNNRGVTLLSMGLKDHAIADFQQAVRLDACLVDARRNLKLAGYPTEIPAHCRVSDERRREFEGESK